MRIHDRYCEWIIVKTSTGLSFDNKKERENFSNRVTVRRSSFFGILFHSSSALSIPHDRVYINIYIFSTASVAIRRLLCAYTSQLPFICRPRRIHLVLRVEVSNQNKLLKRHRIKRDEKHRLKQRRKIKKFSYSKKSENSSFAAI